MAPEDHAVSIYLDHNVNLRLAEDLRRLGIDAIHAVEVGNHGLADEDQLAWAAERGRVMVTFDLDDFPILAARWFERGKDHAGMVLPAPPRITYQELLRRLLALLRSVSADNVTNQVLWLDGSW